jgi:hypothetical protein
MRATKAQFKRRKDFQRKAADAGWRASKWWVRVGDESIYYWPEMNRTVRMLKNVEFYGP